MKTYLVYTITHQRIIIILIIPISRVKKTLFFDQGNKCKLRSPEPRGLKMLNEESGRQQDILECFASH